MGHTFCHSKWRVKQEDVWKGWKESPCFAHVKPLYLESQSIQVELTPTLKGKTLHKSDLTSVAANLFIDDVLEVCPGVTERVDTWTFEYKLGSHKRYWRFLGTASLLRAVEEWWHWIDNYFEMRNVGIPKDVALICMGLYEKDFASPSCGHMIIDSLANLNSLKDFSLKDTFLKQCAKGTAMSSLWSLIKQPPWFTQQWNFPGWFKMTPQVYKAFTDGTSIVERQQLVTGRTYFAVS